MRLIVGKYGMKCVPSLNIQTLDIVLLTFFMACAEVS